MKRIIKWLTVVAILVGVPGIAAAVESFTVSVPNKVLELPKADWNKLEDTNKFATNYEQKQLAAWHEYGRVVTVYSIPMSVDRRLGIQMSEYEYVEFFIVHPGFVTAQTRVDKGSYWVLCRETFKPRDTPGVETAEYRPYLSDEQNRVLWATFQAEIDETRYLLNSVF